ncbi:MAG TPA: YdcF family protein [Alphaproteobacteria bacterium]
MDFYVVFGAKVGEGGVPSGTLRRRVEGAFALGGSRPESRYLVTGGLGRHPPAEADVMARLLIELGVPVDQIILEREGLDTLSSARICAGILASRGDVARTIVCSSPYHNFRCHMLLRMMGIQAERGAMPSDRPALGVAKWLFYCLREVVALPYDLLLVVMRAI